METVTATRNPLIKWPGGKSREFVYIDNMIPSFDRYVEPFFGGGGVFFQMCPQKAIINDICKELMDFYKFVKGEYDRESFKTELYEYVINWEKIPNYLKVFEGQFIKMYKDYKEDKISQTQLNVNIRELIENSENKFNGLFNNKFCLNRQNLLKEIILNLTSKMHRTKKVEQERGTISESDLEKNIETAFRSGFYMHFRDVMNFNGNKYKADLAKITANYYFIREFCYGAMFRFNSNGHFNIPYGGMAYNSKYFRGKVDYIFSEEIKDLFANVVIKNQDFEQFFERYKFDENDFIFLDPPYDSDFSDYEKKTFDKNDQKRLANCLLKTKGKFILIIKNTEFIYGLYGKKSGIHIDSFEKTYLYNVKGRNQRDAEHLIVYNF